MLSFFPQGVLDEILNLIESVSEEFPFYSWIYLFVTLFLMFQGISLSGGTEICTVVVLLPLYGRIFQQGVVRFYVSKIMHL